MFRDGRDRSSGRDGARCLSSALVVASSGRASRSRIVGFHPFAIGTPYTRRSTEQSQFAQSLLSQSRARAARKLGRPRSGGSNFPTMGPRVSRSSGAGNNSASNSTIARSNAVTITIPLRARWRKVSAEASRRRRRCPRRARPVLRPQQASRIDRDHAFNVGALVRRVPLALAHAQVDGRPVPHARGRITTRRRRSRRRRPAAAGRRRRARPRR